MRKRTLLALLAAVLINAQVTAQLTNKELFVHYDSAWTFKNLQLIPVRFKGEKAISISGINYTTFLSFSNALQKHKIKLQEMQYEQGADVNWLQVTNHSKQKVIVQGGEIVSGGKQDRMVAETKILEPGKTDYLHVYCVEKRRWDDKAKDFAWQGIANSELRKAMDITARQSEVWKEIDRQFAALKKTSNTFSYLNLYPFSTRSDTSYSHFYNAKYAAADSNFAGFIFITGNRIISCELFSSADLTNITFNNMLNSYVNSVNINGAVPAVTHTEVKQFLNKVISDELSQKAFVTAHGKLHMYEGKIIHLVAYPD